MRYGIAIGLGLAFYVGAGMSPALAQAIDLLDPAGKPMQAVSGAFDLSQPRSGRKCRVQLNRFTLQGKTPFVGMPPACRASMPILQAVAGWGLTSNGSIRLLRADGGDVATFTRITNSGPFNAIIGGDAFLLEPVGARYGESERRESVDTALANASVVSESEVATAKLAGRYGIGRESGRSICSIRFEATSTGQRGVRRAAMDGACSDDGLRTFDPAGWKVEGDRMFLIARKGHSVGFSTERDSAWRKDPPAGRPLFLMRQPD